MKQHNLKNYLTLALLSLVMVNCNNEEETKYYHTINFPIIDYPGFAFHDDVKVTLYLTEEDYLLEQNPFLQTEVDGSLTLIYTTRREFYYRATKGNLNNLRLINVDKTFNDNNNFLTTQWRDSFTGSATCNLSTTPTRLLFSITNDQLQPIQGATVQIYLSEDDFNNNITPWRTIANESILGDYCCRPDIDIDRIFAGDTDSAGEVLFNDLAPRQYWFKVTKGSLTNAGGVVKTTTALPDNADVTTVLSVVIE